MQVRRGSQLQSGLSLEGHAHFDPVGDLARQFDLLAQCRDVGRDLIGFERDALHALRQALHQVVDLGHELFHVVHWKGGGESWGEGGKGRRGGSGENLAIAEKVW